jgi:hypothetical protein
LEVGLVRFILSLLVVFTIACNEQSEVNKTKVSPASPPAKMPELPPQNPVQSPVPDLYTYMDTGLAQCLTQITATTEANTKVTIPDSLSKKLTNYLYKNFDPQGDMIPEKFWDYLSLELNKKIHDLLVYNDINASAQTFAAKKKLFALAILYSLDHPNKGRITVGHPDLPLPRLTVIMARGAENSHLVLCNARELDFDYEVTTDLPHPSDIDFSISCTKKQNVLTLLSIKKKLLKLSYNDFNYTMSQDHIRQLILEKKRKIQFRAKDHNVTLKLSINRKSLKGSLYLYSDDFLKNKNNMNCLIKKRWY